MKRSAETARRMAAALAEIGHKTDNSTGEVLMDWDVPPMVALRAWQIAHDDHTMTLAEYVASLKANYPKLAAGYDRWLEQHGVTIIADTQQEGA